jgi:hypothetical protein
MPSQALKLPTRIPGSSPPTVDWTAVDDEHRYHRLLMLIFSRAEATVLQASGQRDDDEWWSARDEPSGAQGRQAA